MTHHDDPAPLPPPPPGYDAEETAFASFTRGFRPLADDLTRSTGTDLGAHTSLHGDTFSRVGNEVGLSDAVRDATRRQVDRVNGLAGGTTDMADAVSSTWTNYTIQEDDHARIYRRAAGETT
jgi:hypothetical protein